MYTQKGIRNFMIRAVIFDMFETLITHYRSKLYFGSQIAKDMGISEDKFRVLWDLTEYDRSIGKLTLEEVLESILRENKCYSEKLLNEITEKRKEVKRECFRNLHSEIIPMLSKLKEREILVGLISNCFSEEAEVIRKSKLFPYFDVVMLSWEQGVSKPDEEIFERCMKRLSVKPEECLYIGDGGSFELETAKKLGMTAAQAVWYLREGNNQPSGRKKEFWQMEKPLDVLNYLDS